MLKEVGASGQISLGKRFAGQLFQVLFHPDGRIELRPMKAVPAATVAPVGHRAESSDAWLPPGGYAASNAWALNNRDALQAYADRISANGTAADELQAWLDEHAGPEQR